MVVKKRKPPVKGETKNAEYEKQLRNFNTGEGGHPTWVPTVEQEKQFVEMKNRKVTTLLDNSKADRPERRTVLVARELARYKVDIADKGQLTETGGGYTFFWCGRSSEERCEAGVGFAIKTAYVPKLASIPEGLKD